MDKVTKMEAFGYVNEIMGHVDGPDTGTVRFHATGEIVNCAAWKVIAYGKFTWLVIMEKAMDEHIEDPDRTTLIDMDLGDEKYSDMKVDFSKDRRMLISYYQYPYES